MRTKTLLITAAIGAAGIASSMAQQAVYSLNIVGYVNLPVNAGLSMVANQLDATPDNGVQGLFGTPPGALTLNKFNPATGTYQQAIFDPDAGWSDPTAMKLNPGEGAFVDNPNATFTITLVGQVHLSSTVNVTQGLGVYSSVIPQSAPIDTLGFPTPAGALTVSRWNGHGFDPFIFDPDAGGWAPSVPTPRVGESFFIDNASGASLAWTRNFTVGP